MSRAAALRSVFQVLERNLALTTAIGHSVGAKTLSSGARIIAQDVYLDDINDKLPLIIFRVPNNQSRGNVSPRLMTVNLEVHAKDVFEVSNVLDLIQDACECFRSNNFLDLPAHLNAVSVGDDQELQTGDPTIRIPAAFLQLSVMWTPK